MWKRLFIRNTFRWKLQPKGVLIRTYNSVRFLFLLLFLGLGFFFHLFSEVSDQGNIQHFPWLCSSGPSECSGAAEAGGSRQTQPVSKMRGKSISFSS